MKLSEIDATLREIRVSPVRTLGQNFLHDRNLARWIVEKAELSPDDYVRSINEGFAEAKRFGTTTIANLTEKRLHAMGVRTCLLDGDNILSGPLRFEDEFVRHKILDLVGDLALLGRPVEGKIHARKAGHALHAELVRELAEEAALPVREAMAYRPIPSFAS